MRVRRVLASVAAAAMVVGGMSLVAAPAASANEVWHQHIGRASADAACPKNTAAETAAGWSEWAPSWAQWPGGGTGGWVCGRSAPVSTVSTSYPSGIGCVAAGTGTWANFAGNWYLPSGSPFFASADCGSVSQYGVSSSVVVYAPPGFDALTLCRVLVPATVSVFAPSPAQYLYDCSTS